MGRENAARLYLIGSPFVRLGDERLALPNRKLLALMAVLALDGPTERARLAELLWSGADMDSRGRLRRELYRLRGTPGATLILEEDQVLRLGNVSSDLADFRLALEKQDWAAAENLGRGTLLEGLVFDLPEFDDWLEFHRVEFDESYRSVLLQSALDLEARGLTREALEVFERLWRLDSLNEEAVRGAMRVLEIIGDSTRMLAVYKQFSDQLEFELGIKPSLDTQNLAAKARGERLELAPVISSLQQKAPKPFRSDSPLFGREQAWRQLEAAWLAGKIIFICGEPGIGKSSLMLEFAISKTMPHEQVLAVHRHADSQIAFSGLARLLRALQHNQTADKLPTWARSELACLLPELGDIGLPVRGRFVSSRIAAFAQGLSIIWRCDRSIWTAGKMRCA